MKTLSFIHRWTGGFLGLILAILGLSGTILLWDVPYGLLGQH